MNMTYDELAQKIENTIAELNCLLQQAYERKDMHVFIQAYGGPITNGKAIQYRYMIVKPTHNTIKLP